MGDLYRHYSVVQAGRNVSMFFQSMFLLVEEEDCLFGHLCSRCHPVDGQALVKLALQIATSKLPHTDHKPTALRKTQFARSKHVLLLF